MSKNHQGTVYLIHLESKLGHSQHYIGWTINMKARFSHHENNTGSRFLAACNKVGIKYKIVRTWLGSKQLERQLKNRKEGPRLCPICRKELGLPDIKETLTL